MLYKSICTFSGQCTVLLLEREDAVTGWRALMGPTDPDEAREKAPDSYVMNLLLVYIIMHLSKYM